MSEWLLMFFVVVGQGVYQYGHEYYPTREACEAAITELEEAPSEVEGGFVADCLPVGAKVDEGRESMKESGQ